MRIRRLSSDFIVTPKAVSPIPAGNGAYRDLVIQSVLDAHVRRIEYVHDLPYGPLVLHRDDGSFLLDIVGTRPERSASEEASLVADLSANGIERLEIEPQDINRQPRFENARRIWEHCDERALPRDRDRTLHFLTEHGPQSIRDIGRCVALHSDVLHVVCVLACEDEVEVDMDGGPLGPATIVRVRR